MERISTGWRLARQSLAVVRSDPALAGLVIVGGVLAALVVLPGVTLALLVSDGDEPSAAAWVVLAVAGYLIHVVTVFSGVALVHAAARVIDGEDATVHESIAFGFERLRPILGWAFVGALVSLAFSLMRRAGLIGAVLAGLAGTAWSLVTFLAVPVVAFEGLGPIATLKRSAELFRQRWGEQITGNIGIGLVFFLLSLPALVLVVVGIVLVVVGEAGLLGWLVLLAGVLAIGAVTVLGRAASATFGAVLYYYAVTGEAPPQFAEGDLRAVARPV
jgi:Family of unknown function (DUF6159)